MRAHEHPFFDLRMPTLPQTADGVLETDTSLGVVFLRPITNKPPKRRRDALEAMAHYFGRETGMGHLYSAIDGLDDGDHAYLFTTYGEVDFQQVVVGGAIFRRHEFTDHPPILTLAWIWLHPYLRRRGILSACWPYFRKAHGQFTVDEPHSDAMEAFLARATIEA